MFDFYNSSDGFPILNFSLFLPFQELQILDLSGNYFDGWNENKDYDSSGSSKKLKILNLNYNNFNDSVLPYLNTLTSLTTLNLYYNRIGGLNPSQGLANLRNLKALNLSWNGISSGATRLELAPFRNLKVLGMRNNLLNGSVESKGICQLKNLTELDLRENNLEGQLPWRLSDLTGLKVFDISSNQLSGNLPSVIANLTSLEYLVLSDNNFQGEFPLSLLTNHSNLEVLRLLKKLRILDLSHNKLNGSIPSCFANVLFWREGNGDLYGSGLDIYFQFGGLRSIGTYYNSTLDLWLSRDDYATLHQRAQVQFVTKNRYEFYNGSSLNYMSGMDLSYNELTGEIPSEIGELPKVRALNLSHTSLSGSIPGSFSNLKMMESLDLSDNELSGQIPMQLTELNALSDFNVSYNNLFGPIPDKGQFATFDDSSYRGNSDLCGPLLNKSCGNTLPPTVLPPNHAEQDESAIDMDALYWSFIGSYVTILLGLLIGNKIQTMKGWLPMETSIVKFSVSLTLLALIQMHGYQGCLEKERIGLLQLKSFFISISDSENKYNIPNSWVDDDPMSDCCDWERVKCNATTRRVMQLSLDILPQNKYNDFIDGSPLLNMSLLLPFEELQSLDLSFNLFEGVYKGKAYDSFGSLKQLKMLNLGYNLFNDSILPYLNTLSSLTTLILAGNNIDGSRTKQGLVNLRNLQVLDLSGNRISAGSVTRLGIANLTNLEALDLRGNRINGSVTRLELGNLRKLKRLGLGLENLRNLEVLQLSEIRMSGSASRLGLAKFKNLKALDLSYTGINGSLENQGICELKNLIELNLEGNAIGGPLPQCLKNLTRLKVFGISSNQLSGSPHSVITSLTSLQYLDLSDNYFQGIFYLSSLGNHSNLEFFMLSLVNNTLVVETENWLPTSQLKVLHLRNCNLNGTLGFLQKQHDLKSLDLSHNKLVGNFPAWLLQYNTKLEVLRFTNNSFTGSLQLSNSKLDFLHHLDISSNSFSGRLPQNMSTILQKLVYLDMSKNKFEGSISSSISEMKDLRILDLSRNQFSGELSAPLLTGCFSLLLLDLSHNSFSGQVSPKFMNLTQLGWLSLDNNNFSGRISNGFLSSARSLEVLDISNNKLVGQIPSWIGNLSSLLLLSVSKNLLEGDIPVQLNNLEALEILDVSENNLSGSIIYPFNPSSSVKHLYMQKNSLCGSIPQAFFSSSKLMTLDLGDNKFSGSIPHQINGHSELRVLILRGNCLQGHIPNQLCKIGKLGIMDLSHNRLNGSIPSCFANVSHWRAGNDDLYGSEREFSWSLGVDSIGIYFNTSDLDLEFYGDDYTAANGVEVEFVTKNRYEVYNSSNLNYMTGLDLSCNELTGEIPAEIGELQKVRALNLSHNYLSGSIPESFSNLKMIESLDLCHNKLSGLISPKLTELNFLSNFNVSYNNLSGLIPDKGQFGTFDEMSYKGNLGLCGPTINKSCTRAEANPATSSYQGEDEDESAIDMVSFNWSFGASYVTFMLGLFAILWLNSYWRWLWFCFIDACIDWCFYWLVKFVYFVRDRARP
ncbi:Receptor-like protein 13 [Citrus sinensis]|nr:Receptor-like protein 13 [Citrus sinensis]